MYDDLNFVSAEEAVKIVNSGDRVFIHSAAATPQYLVNAMTNRWAELKNVEIVSIHTEGDTPYLDEKYSDSFKVNTFFVGANTRKAVQSGRANYIPMFLSEIPALLKTGGMPLDVALVQVSPPDKHGYCSIGVSVDIANAAIDTAKHVIAQVNNNMPRVHGNGIIHISTINAVVECHDPLFEIEAKPPTPEEAKIGHFISEIVEDGATLQTGIGGIPNAALLALKGHKNLGMHSEMFSDGVVDLVECGAMNGLMKKRQWGKIVAGFCIVREGCMILLMTILWLK